jgi:hypothetical protein
MASVYEKYYERQPAAVKVIAVAGLALGGYLLYRANKKAADLKQANEAGTLANNELAVLAQQGVHPSYSDSQFQVFVDTLVQAMTGCGTDEDSIYSVFHQLRNEADIRKLIAQFGVQFYQPCVWTSPISYSIWQVDDQHYGGGLATWLGYDLSSDNISEINGILRSNGINYQF